MNCFELVLVLAFCSISIAATENGNENLEVTTQTVNLVPEKRFFSYESKSTPGFQTQLNVNQRPKQYNLPRPNFLNQAPLPYGQENYFTGVNPNPFYNEKPSLESFSEYPIHYPTHYPDYHPSGSFSKFYQFYPQFDGSVFQQPSYENPRAINPNQFNQYPVLPPNQNFCP